jgi:hypothetical protein
MTSKAAQPTTKSRSKQVPELTISDECRYCAENDPEWSSDAKCWIHRRASLDKRCTRKVLGPCGEMFPKSQKAIREGIEEALDFMSDTKTAQPTVGARISQVTVIGKPQPKSWADYRAGALANYGGGHRTDGHLEAFHHGIKTVFNLLEAEFPPAEQCKSAGELLEALEAVQRDYAAFNSLTDITLLKIETVIAKGKP